MALDPYFQLGVECDADAAAIRRAFKRKAQQIHPDKNPNDPLAEAKYSLLRESYEILSDQARRSAYDREGVTARNDLPQRALITLREIAVGLLGQIEQAGQMGEVDFVAALRYSLAESKRMQEHERALYRRAILGYQKQLKRVRRKTKGENLLGELLAIKLAQAQDAKKVNDGSVEEFDAALAMLNDYEDINLEELLALGQHREALPR